MTPQTEMTFRSLLAMDQEVRQELVERAVDARHLRLVRQRELSQVIRYKDAMKLLGVSRDTINYYVRHGHLERVYGCGRQRALGISKASYVRFTTRHF